MKKRLLALLLAGLLTASMGSCISREGSRAVTNGGIGGTEGIQNPPSSTEESKLPPAPTAWEDSDDFVYVTEVSVSLRVNISTTEGSIRVEGATKLHRVKTSTSWSQVEYDGRICYVANDFITTDDLLGEGFVACAPTQKMYATTGVNIRKYASATAKISEAIGGLKQNDEVTVVAKGEKWNKIMITAENGDVSFGFVKAEYLSDKPVAGGVNTDYSKFFDTIEAKTMYVAEGQYYLRYEPHKDGAIRDTLAVTKENPVVTLKVTGTGKGDYAEWYRVSYPDTVKEGDPQTYTDCYIHVSCLKEDLEDTTLDGFLALYPTFTKCDEVTLYVLASTPMNARKTPVFEGTDNIGATLLPKAAVKVVASGMVGESLRYIIEYEAGVYYFVTAKYLTPNASGEPAPLSLTELLSQYKSFTACDAVEVFAIGKVNCYNTPTAVDTVPKTLALGEKATMLAKSNDGVWCIIQIGEDLFFAGLDRFSEIAPAG